MTKQSDLLSSLRVASPCHVGWERMSGDDRVRFCDSCQLNVYNFSEMTPKEVESLILESKGRVCGRIYRRADGTLLTRDCPVGLRAVRRRVARFATSVFATIISICGVTLSQSKQNSTQPKEGPEFKLERVLSDANKVGTLSGTVTDALGAVIVGAVVSLQQSQSDKTIRVRTNDEGTFSVSGLADGRYEMKVSAPGFSTYSIVDVQIKSTESYRAKVSLAVEVLGGVIFISEELKSPGGQMMLGLVPTTKSSIIRLPVNR